MTPEQFGKLAKWVRSEAHYINELRKRGCTTVSPHDHDHTLDCLRTNAGNHEREAYFALVEKGDRECESVRRFCPKCAAHWSYTQCDREAVGPTVAWHCTYCAYEWYEGSV